MDRETINMIRLKHIVELLNKNNIHHWLYGGLLLGWYRNGRPLEWENDADLFVWEQDFSKVKALHKEFKEHGFKTIYKENSIALKNPYYEIGFQFYRQEGDKAICPSRLVTRSKFDRVIYFGLLSKASKYDMKRTVRFLRWYLLKFGNCYLITQKVPIDYFLQLQEINMFGIKINVPLDMTGFFEHTLGNDWETPKQSFDRPPEYYVLSNI